MKAAISRRHGSLPSILRALTGRDFPFSLPTSGGALRACHWLPSAAPAALIPNALLKWIAWLIETPAGTRRWFMPNSGLRPAKPKLSSNGGKESIKKNLSTLDASLGTFWLNWFAFMNKIVPLPYKFRLKESPGLHAVGELNARQVDSPLFCNQWQEFAISPRLARDKFVYKQICPDVLQKGAAD